MSHVAILGAGIMGAATALSLARRGQRVTVFDRAAAPFSGASRWNEGKIHLGYLYAGDPSLATAARVIPGGLAFRSLTEDLIGESLAPAISERDDVYAIHRQSVVGVDAAAAYYRAVSALVASHPEASRAAGAAPPRRLTASELEADYDAAQIVAAFAVPERSVSTGWVADRFVAALAAEPRIEQRLGVRVRGVHRLAAGLDAPLRIDTDAGLDGPFTMVVNCLWEGRLAVDATIGLAPPQSWSHRYRLSAFARTSQVVAVPSTVVATGPFGDVKNYNGRDLYISWYATGLLADGDGIEPPPVIHLDDLRRAAIAAEIVTRLGAVVRGVAALPAVIESVTLGGGWVYAAGHGSLADPASTLHRRDHVGITRAGSYISVDTGKYSIAPWLARQVVELVP